MKKARERLLITTAVAVLFGTGIIIGLRVAWDALTTDSNLRKEEIVLSRQIVKQLEEIKELVARKDLNSPGEVKEDEKHPCGGDKPCDKPCGGNKLAPGQPVPTKFQIPPDLGSLKVEGVTPGLNQVKGTGSAPVLIVEFSDFECPFSKKFYRETFPQIEKNYISTGKVKFAYRDFPLGIHSRAVAASVASRCAGRSGKFWEMFDKLGKVDNLDQNTITMSAKEIGMDKDSFTACLNDPEVKNEVRNDMAEGSKLGVTGTPVFFINGRMIRGAVAFEGFKQVIDQELKKAGK